jgi:pimeloyl-ACP methyl ester carboxylesterase
MSALHHVRVGAGPPVLLLHGWPQSSHAWRGVAALLGDHDVVMVDLRGFGRSPKPQSGYDAATMAADLHELLRSLELEGVTVVGHDWGAVFGYALAASHPGDVAALGIVEMVLPGLGMLEEAMRPRPEGRFLWHLGFQSVPDVPELLIQGREREYVDWFFEHHAHAPGAVDAGVYAEALREPGALSASLGVYRAYFETAEQIAALAERPLEIPVVAYGGESSLGELALASARRVAPAARGGVIADCGHWAPEESPRAVAELIRELAG